MFSLLKSENLIAVGKTEEEKNSDFSPDFNPGLSPVNLQEVYRLKAKR